MISSYINGIILYFLFGLGIAVYMVENERTFSPSEDLKKVFFIMLLWPLVVVLTVIMLIDCLFNTNREN